MIDLTSIILGRKLSLHETLNLLESASGSGTPTVGYGHYAVTISSWTADGALYYADVVHNLNSEDLTYSFKHVDNSTTIFPQKLIITDVNTFRVWFTSNARNVRVNVVR